MQPLTPRTLDSSESQVTTPIPEAAGQCRVHVSDQPFRSRRAEHTAWDGGPEGFPMSFPHERWQGFWPRRHFASSVEGGLVFPPTESRPVREFGLTAPAKTWSCKFRPLRLNLSLLVDNSIPSRCKVDGDRSSSSSQYQRPARSDKTAEALSAPRRRDKR